MRAQGFDERMINNEYHVRAQGFDERMINVHYYNIIIILMPCWRRLCIIHILAHSA